MTKRISQHHALRITQCVLVLSLALTVGCSSKPSYYAATQGSNCFAKAVPTLGEGGLAWGNTLSIAKQKSLNNCIRYAGRSGGTPNTCQVVLAECKR
ncbi:hypothetical protein [Pseudomonas sp. PSKL.D1]|uniref:hypothetical protein n=1 Tax=Pseudomonas sp. PSKL.D1 TaxID=3029060 RepID=UPI002381028D|nr:hypothetical protein [Pseudomonas sp. PSKL.D1]WDY60168.1 hypothetical protein PVV54_11265 [Pseudomonas sp. PSKL.D1]